MSQSQDTNQEIQDEAARHEANMNRLVEIHAATADALGERYGEAAGQLRLAHNALMLIDQQKVLKSNRELVDSFNRMMITDAEGNPILPESPDKGDGMLNGLEDMINFGVVNIGNKGMKEQKGWDHEQLQAANASREQVLSGKPVQPASPEPTPAPAPQAAPQPAPQPTPSPAPQIQAMAASAPPAQEPKEKGGVWGSLGGAAKAAIIAGVVGTGVGGLGLGSAVTALLTRGNDAPAVDKIDDTNTWYDIRLRPPEKE